MLQHTVTRTEEVRYSSLGHSSGPQGVIYCCLGHWAGPRYLSWRRHHSLASESFLSNYCQQETHKKRSRLHNWKTSRSTSSPPSIVKFPSLISEDALLTHFFCFLISQFFYPPPPLITSYPYLLSSLALKLRSLRLSQIPAVSLPVCLHRHYGTVQLHLTKIRC